MDALGVEVASRAETRANTQESVIKEFDLNMKGYYLRWVLGVFLVGLRHCISLARELQT